MQHPCYYHPAQHSYSRKGLSPPQIHRVRRRGRRIPHPRSVESNKEERQARADKDLLMVHFSGTEGKEEIKWLWDEGQERGPRKTPAGQTASPNQTCSTIAGCPERNSENGADSSSEPLSKPPPPPPSLHPPKKKKKKSKTFLGEPICLAEVQTELRWHSPMLMILGIRIYKVKGWKESFHQGRIL